MPSGRAVTHMDRERVWAMVDRGGRSLHAMASAVNLDYQTVREIVFQASTWALAWHEQQRQIAQLDALTEPREGLSDPG